jgi:hypothetical protein
VTVASIILTTIESVGTDNIIWEHYETTVVVNGSTIYSYYGQTPVPNPAYDGSLRGFSWSEPVPPPYNTGYPTGPCYRSGSQIARTGSTVCVQFPSLGDSSVWVYAMWDYIDLLLTTAIDPNGNYILDTPCLTGTTTGPATTLMSPAGVVVDFSNALTGTYHEYDLRASQHEMRYTTSFTVPLSGGSGIVGNPTSVYWDCLSRCTEYSV